jgi:hypothetical protein
MIALAAGLKDGTEMIDATDRLALPGGRQPSSAMAMPGRLVHARLAPRARSSKRQFRPEDLQCLLMFGVVINPNDLAGALSLLPKL